jgi:predicted nucleic acid-binding protein
MFNYYFDVEREAHEATVMLFDEIAAGKYEAYTSTYVVDELEKAPQEKYLKMVGLISEYNIHPLLLNLEAEQLADVYVAEGIIPKKYRTDGIHIAVAAINNLDMIISTNFRHIVKVKTMKMTAEINTKRGYPAITICSPMEVVEYEED